MAPNDELAAQLEVERLDAGDGIRVVVLTGELDMTTTHRFGASVQEALDEGARALVVDLTQLTFIDSSGLAARRAALRSRGLAGARLVVAGSNPTGSNSTCTPLPTAPSWSATTRRLIARPRAAA